MFDEAHLRRVLKSYASYYNEVRTHLSLGKNAPDFRHPQKLSSIASISILGGLHHHGRATSLAAIASREGVTARYVARLIRLAFLAPKIVEAIAERGELPDLKLAPHVHLPFDWTTRSEWSASNNLFLHP